MSFEFLAVDAAVTERGYAPVARSPMERATRAAGARFERRDGWNVAVAYTTPDAERRSLRDAAAWADVSHLGKLEIQAAPHALMDVVSAVTGAPGLELGRALHADGGWWLPYTRERALVVCAAAATGALRARIEERALATAEFTSVVEVTTGLAAMVIAGPRARDLIARFSAVDLRPSVCRPSDFKPVSIARTPGAVLVEDTGRYLLLVGSALGDYLWEVVADAGARLGAAPVGVDVIYAAKDVAGHA